MLLDFNINFCIGRNFLFNGFRQLMREAQRLKASDPLLFAAQIDSLIQLHSSARSGLLFLQTIAVFVPLVGQRINFRGLCPLPYLPQPYFPILAHMYPLLTCILSCLSLDRNPFNSDFLYAPLEPYHDPELRPRLYPPQVPRSELLLLLCWPHHLIHVEVPDVVPHL